MIEKEVKINPHNPDAFWVMADLIEYAKAECGEDCLKFKAMAFQQASEEIEYLVYYLNSSIENGFEDIAIETINQVEDDFDHAILKSLKAEALFYLGQYNNSKFFAEEYLKTDPKSELMLFILCQNHFYLDELDEALRVALELNSANPNEDLNKDTLAEIYYYQEEDELAMQICEKEMKAQSKSSVFYLMAFDIYFEREDIDKALDLFGQAYEKEDFWEEIFDSQLVSYFEGSIELDKKSNVNKVLEAMDANFEDENKFCIRDYYHYKINDPESIGKITVKCKECIEGFQSD